MGHINQTFPSVGVTIAFPKGVVFMAFTNQGEPPIDPPRRLRKPRSSAGDQGDDERRAEAVPAFAGRQAETTGHGIHGIHGIHAIHGMAWAKSGK